MPNRLKIKTHEARYNSDADLFDQLYAQSQELRKWRKGELPFKKATGAIIKALARRIGPRTAHAAFKSRGVKDSYDYLTANCMAEYAAVACLDKGEDFIKSFLDDKSQALPNDVWDNAAKQWKDDAKDL